uniref:Reverse transcriptase domain-containing protein n=1 Tax=Amphimedon queenslandica TaxID=400682 RepID=A0A1X7TNP0_AMPQE
MGDFNAPDDLFTLSGDTHYSLTLRDLVFNFNLSQVVQVPTHNKGNTLDIVLTSIPEAISNVIATPITSFNTDHSAVMFQVSHLRDVSPTLLAKPVYDSSKAEWTGLVEYLLDFNFGPLLNDDNIESVWLSFKDLLLSTLHQYIPLITICSTTNYIPWLRGPLNHQLKSLRTLWRRFKANPSANLEQKLLKAEEAFATNYKNAKHVYERHLVTDSLPHLSVAFKYIRRMTETDVFTDCSDFDFDPAFSSSHHDQFSSICCEEDQVFQELSSLDGTKALGIDGIGPLYLKRCPVALTPLTYLFNLFLSTHSLPLDWRTHLIQPIFKSGDKCKVANYRPISLLPAISKVMEKIIHNKIAASTLLFADDSKRFNKISSTIDCSLLQEKLDAALKWSDKWDLKFNLSNTSL